MTLARRDERAKPGRTKLILSFGLFEKLLAREAELMLQCAIRRGYDATSAHVHG